MIGLSKKDAGTTSPAPVWDMDRATDARRINGGWNMRTTTMISLGEKISPGEKISRIRTDEMAAEFSAVILHIPAKRLSRASGASVDTAKCWKSARAMPNGKHLLALITEFPHIRAWANRRTGGIDNQQSFSEAMTYIEKTMASDTAEGRAMRARIQQLMAEEGGSNV